MNAIGNEIVILTGWDNTTKIILIRGPYTSHHTDGTKKKNVQLEESWWTRQMPEPVAMLQR